MAYVPHHRHDLFFSYAHEDDSAWIEAFCKGLKTELVRAVGAEFDVWQDATKLRLGQNWADEIDQGISTTALFLAVCSPSYYRSEWCEKEWQTFFERNQATVDDPSSLKVGETGAYRFVKAVMRLNQQRVRMFPQFQEVRLYDDQGSQYGADSVEFRKLVLKTAKDLEYILESMRRSKVGVFVAAAAADLRDDRKALLRELSVSDFDVRPNFNLNAAVDPETLRTTMDGAQLAVFTLGATYDTFVQEQIDCAQQLHIPITYWIDPRKTEAEPEQAKLIGALREQGCAVLNGLSIRQVAEQVVARLHFKETAGVREGGMKSVFLLYDPTTPVDGDFANGQLGPMLREQGLTVLKPDTQHASTDRLLDRDRFLEQFDGVLLYRDQAPDGWLWPNLMELSVADTAKSCILPPGQTGTFARFVPVIERGADFGPAQLAPFLEQVRAGRP